jgi:phospholipid-translocating P-type ATPase (flippase)
MSLSETSQAQSHSTARDIYLSATPTGAAVAPLGAHHQQRTGSHSSNSIQMEATSSSTGGMSDSPLSDPGELPVSASLLFSTDVARTSTGSRVHSSESNADNADFKSEELDASADISIGDGDDDGDGETKDDAATKKSDLKAAVYPRILQLSPNNDSEEGTAKAYTTNLVRTSRYTALNFVPKNLWEQLTEYANFYFFCIGILQIIPQISASQGIPTMYIPLSFILMVSGLRAAIEDYHRHQTDRREGARMYDCFQGTQAGGFVPKASADIAVGNIIKIKSNQPFPSDCLCIRSSNEKGHCFVETANLDGETDLKPRIAVSAMHQHYTTPEKLDELSGKLAWEAPNRKFEQFKGYLEIEQSADEKIQLEAENLLLRGTVLRNTEYVLGIVVYTGEDSKIRCNLNQQKHRLPKSSVMKTVDRGYIYMVILQIFMCFFAAVYAGVWYDHHESVWYLQFDESGATEGTLRFFTWFIIMSQLVPIALLVTSEIVKSFQAYFINSDITIYDPETDTPTLVRSSMLNEELGQVQYIFTDKTGTLTQNRMEFRVAFIRCQMFGSAETEISKRVRQRQDALEAKQRGEPVETKRSEWTTLVKELEAQKQIQKESGTVFDAKEQYLDYMWLGTKPDVSIDMPQLASLRSQSLDDTKRGDHNDEEPECTPEQLKLFLTHMAISNTITPIEEKNGETVYQSSSPDELALCNFARSMGFELVSRNPTRVRISTFGRGTDTVHEFRHLATLGFNSKRKRVSMIYEFGDRIYVMMKGADSSVIQFCPAGRELDIMNAQLVDMARKGLRTLVVAHAEQSTVWWDEWRSTYEYLTSLPEAGEEAGHQKGACGDDCRVCEHMRKMEMAAGFQLLGATAIEDRLQDLVPEAIGDFLEAGVKVWMLTGDKRETAKNIAMACNLIDPDMEDPEEWRNNRLVEITGQWSKILHEREQLQKLFKVFNKSGDGFLNRDELFAYFDDIGLKDVGVKREEINVLFDAWDADKDGRIEFEEFLQLMRSTNISMLEAVRSDVALGLEVARHCEDKGLPVSMVIEGEAFGVMYPADSDNKKKKKKKKLKLGSKKMRSWFKRMKSREPTELDLKRAEAARKPKQFVAAEIERLKDDFFQLAIRCKSCVACRLTPFQKSKMVEEIRLRKGVVTCAIGDGANDEAMIVEADVGVGITGLEGTAAARASAYSVGQFRFLHTLLFVHGHWSYRRIGKLVPFMFYKGILPIVCMFWFGFFSGFSGKQMFNDYIYTLYNVLFTASPIMVLAIVDRGLSRVTCENNPSAYKAILNGAYFNLRIFFAWVAKSFLHGTIIFFLVFGSYGMDENVDSKDGKTHGLAFLGTVGYTIVVLVSNWRILLEYVSITWIHHLFFWLTFFGYFLGVWIWTLPVTQSFNPDMVGVVERMYGSGAWLVMLVTVTAVMVIEFAIAAYNVQFRPSVSQVLRERERMTPEEVDLLPPLHVKGGTIHDIAAANAARVPFEPELSLPSLHNEAAGQTQLASGARVETLLRNALHKHNLGTSTFSENARSSIFLTEDEASTVRSKLH